MSIAERRSEQRNCDHERSGSGKDCPDCGALTVNGRVYVVVDCPCCGERDRVPEAFVDAEEGRTASLCWDCRYLALASFGELLGGRVVP